jgi:hypothetical protein
MTEPNPHRTPGGRELTDEDVDDLAKEVEETDYDVEPLKARRRGRPSSMSYP